MRYERKFRVEKFSPAVVHQLVRNHPASFRKSYPDRQINNIYFDTANLVAYSENVDGIAERRKFRVRWYGEDIFDIKKPKLEIKIKNNMLGAKESHPAVDFNLKDLKQLTAFISEHSQMKLGFIPTLINSYKRSYYETSNGDYRITIDTDLRYFSLLSSRGFTRYNVRDESVVLELKYDETKEEESGSILQYIPLRYSKSSKYVTGMNLTVG